MQWEKKGLIYVPNPQRWWSKLYGILPTPEWIAADNKIRLYYASTDEQRFGRISFLDVDADDPSRVLYEHPEPLLDLGLPGTFDDCGLNPSAIVQHQGQKYLFYAGYQRSFRSPYAILSGLAISTDGKHFQRHARTPILERTDQEYFIRSAPTVIVQDGQWKMWYVSASEWELMNTPLFPNKMMPVYVIRHAVSADGLQWQVQDGVCIGWEHEDEFGFGRPWVLFEDGLYKMWYSVRRRHTSYRIGYAESPDGLHWTRKDHLAGIDVSPQGWDSEMICYPAVIQVKDKKYLFYNGNNNGETGFGYAELIRS